MSGVYSMRFSGKPNDVGMAVISQEIPKRDRVLRLIGGVQGSLDSFRQKRLGLSRES